MYTPYPNPHHSQDYGYYAPEPYQNQGPPAMNPFIANPGPKRKRNRKQKEVVLPVVPQPGTAAAAAAAAGTAAVPAAAPAVKPTPVPAKPAAPAEEQQLEWVLVPKGTTSSNTVAPTSVEPEPEKVSDKLADAQKEVDRAQWLVEAAMTILVEPRRGYPLEEFGILEAYLPAERIEVVTAVTTLTSIFLSGYWFFQKLGLPDKRENRVLGRAQVNTHFSSKGVLADFTNLSHLPPAEQNKRLAEYEKDIQRVIRAFLAQFVGHQTMHRTPAIMIRMGAPSTLLHKFMSQCYLPLPFMKECKDRFTIHNSLHAVQDQDPITLAETVRLDLKELSGPLEHRTAVLKALGIHMRDLTAATAYLETVNETIPWPSIRELENWAGVSSVEHALMDDLQTSVTNNQIELEKMSVLMRALVKKMQQGVVPEPTDHVTLDHEGVELPPLDDDLVSSDEG